MNEHAYGARYLSSCVTYCCSIKHDEAACKESKAEAFEVHPTLTALLSLPGLCRTGGVLMFHGL